MVGGEERERDRRTTGERERETGVGRESSYSGLKIITIEAEWARENPLDV